MIPLLLACASILGPFTASGNFPRDLYGPVDLRDTRPTACAGGPCIWGHADYDVLPIKFHPPAGYRVRILAIRGDLTAWWKTVTPCPTHRANYICDAPLPAGSSAGVLGAFQTPSAGLKPSPDCDYCDSGCPLYIQDAITAEQTKTRAAFDYQTDFLLDADNTLLAKVAAFLNTGGRAVHTEITYVLRYQFEKGDQ